RSPRRLPATRGGGRIVPCAAARRFEGEGRGSGSRGTRGAEDRAEGLSEGPPPDRAAALQGHHHVEAVASRRLAGHASGQGPGGRVPPALQATARMAEGQGRVLSSTGL